MNKKVFIVSGSSTGKNRFNEYVMQEKNIHTWNVNPNNVLTHVATQLGWNGDRDQNYYEFLLSLNNLANKSFDFKINYVLSIARKFIYNPKTQLMIVHGCDRETHIIESLRELCNAKTLHFYDETPIVKEDVLVYNYSVIVTEDFENTVNKILEDN